MPFSFFDEEETPAFSFFEEEEEPKWWQKELTTLKELGKFVSGYTPIKEFAYPLAKGAARGGYYALTGDREEAQRIAREEVDPVGEMGVEMGKGLGKGMLDWLGLAFPDPVIRQQAIERIGGRIKEHGYLAETMHPLIGLGLGKGVFGRAMKLKAPRVEPPVERISIPGITEKVIPEPSGLPAGMIEELLGIKKPTKKIPGKAELARELKKKGVTGKEALPPVTQLAMQIEETAINLRTKMGEGLNLDSFRETWIKDLTDSDIGRPLAEQAVDMAIKNTKKKFAKPVTEKPAEIKPTLKAKEPFTFEAAARAKTEAEMPEMMARIRREEKGVKPPTPRMAKDAWKLTLDQYIAKYARKGQDPGVQRAFFGLNHRKIVSQALSEGKPVPKEVLAEYPDLAKAKPSRQKGLNIYLNEEINYGGEIRTRGSVVAEMQKQGTPQKQIDAYMMGAKAIKEPKPTIPAKLEGLAKEVISKQQPLTQKMRWMQRQLDIETDPGARRNLMSEIRIAGYRVVEYKGKSYIISPKKVPTPQPKQVKLPERIEIRKKLLAEIAEAKAKAPEQDFTYDKVTFKANGGVFTIDNTKKALTVFETQVKKKFPVYRGAQEPKPTKIRVKRGKEVIKPEEALKAGIPFFKTKQERFAQALKEKVTKKKLQEEIQQGSPMITVELKPRDAQPLIQRPSHKYGSVPNELGELETNYGQTAAQAQQLLMLTERDIRIGQGKGRAELAEILQKTSRKNRKKYQTDIAEGLDGPIELTERKNIPGDVKQVIRDLKAVSKRQTQEIIEMKREEIRPYFKRLAEKQYRAERGLKGKRLNETQKGEINTQAENLVKSEVPDDWGIKDYYRHLHLGEYALLRDGEYVGSARNWTEAVNKVAENYVENPEAGMKYEVNLRRFVDPDVVRVSRRRQYKILNDLRKTLNEESTERIQGILRGKIGAREAQRKWAGFMQERKGLPGYSKDVEFVLNYHNSQYHRWKHLYRLKGKIQPLIDKVKREGRTLVAEDIESNLKVLWGQKTKGSRMLDNWLEKVAGGRIRPFALERWSNRIKNITTTLMLKTSLRYNLLNSLQITQTGMVVPYKNLAWAQKAVRTAEGKALLDKHGVYHVVKGTAGELTRMYTPVKVRASMASRILRLSPETANQAEMWLAVYKHGRDALKMTEAKAVDYAFLRGMVYSQFLPLKVNYPRALRSPIMRVGPGMYRTFNIGALELVSDLAKRSARKGIPIKQRMTNIGRLSHFVGANMALGGVRVLTSPIAKVFGGGYLTFKVYNQIKDEYGEKVANLISWGLPSLINSDWSLSVQLLDLPFAENVPEAIGEVALGPAFGTALRIGTQTLSNYGSEDSRLMRGTRAGMQKFGGTRQLLGLEKVLTGDYDFKSSSGKLQFKGNLKDALVQMYGSRPLKSAIQSMGFDALAEVWGERNDAINSATRLMEELREKGTLSAKDDERIMERTKEFNAKWPELAICWSDIVRRADGHDKIKDLGAFERSLKQKGKTFQELFGMKLP